MSCVHWCGQVGILRVFAKIQQLITTGTCRKVLTDKWNLHRQNQAQDEERSIGCVYSVRISAHQQQDEDMQGDQVDDENVTSPSRYLFIKRMLNKSMIEPA